LFSCINFFFENHHLPISIDVFVFLCFQNLRIKNYSDGDWISEEHLAKEMLEYTDERHPWETIEDKLTDIREIMRKVVRRGKDKGPWDSVDEKLTYLTTFIEKLPESNVKTQ